MVPVFAINIFLQLCKTCLSKKGFPNTGIVVKPIISDDFNRRGQVDLVDFQSSPDGEYKWMLQYQAHLTKFCFLRPLKSKEAKEVAIEILKIFFRSWLPQYPKRQWTGVHGIGIEINCKLMASLQNCEWKT